MSRNIFRRKILDDNCDHQEQREIRPLIKPAILKENDTNLFRVVELNSRAARFKIPHVNMGCENLDKMPRMRSRRIRRRKSKYD